MIPTTTGGIAHGTSASDRASQRRCSGWLSSSASPSARQNWIERHRDRPDRADLERVDEEVVVDQAPEVVEPDEVRRHAEAGSRVGEAEVDAARERRHAEHDDRDHRRDQEEQRLAAGERRRPPRLRGAARPSWIRRRGSGTVVMPALRTRSGRRGAARRRRSARGGRDARCAASSSSAAMRARSAEPRSTVVSGGQVTAERLVLSMPTIATSLRDVETGRAKRAQRAERQQVVRAEDRVRPHALEQPLGRLADPGRP